MLMHAHACMRDSVFIFLGTDLTIYVLRECDVNGSRRAHKVRILSQTIFSERNQTQVKNETKQEEREREGTTH